MRERQRRKMGWRGRKLGGKRRVGMKTDVRMDGLMDKFG